MFRSIVFAAREVLDNEAGMPMDVWTRGKNHYWEEVAAERPQGREIQITKSAVKQFLAKRYIGHGDAEM